MSTSVPEATHTHSITARSLASYASALETAGRTAVRYSLVFILMYIGTMKFTAYEAAGISGLVQNSPFMAWTYNFFSVRGLGMLIGSSELAIAALIAVRPWSAKASAIGSGVAVGMFLTTLSFLFTTPGVIEPTLGFPALSVMPGQFLIKDVALLGIALWALGESLKAVCARPN